MNESRGENIGVLYVLLLDLLEFTTCKTVRLCVEHRLLLEIESSFCVHLKICTFSSIIKRAV